MKKTLLVVCVLLVALILGSFANMGLIIMGGKLIPPPPGANVLTMEGLKASIHLFQAQHFLFPFLAHAIGTLVAAFFVAWMMPTKNGLFTAIVGACFFLGGLLNAIYIPAPVWFIALDLLCAYFPMAWLGFKLSPKPYFVSKSAV